MSRVKTEHLPGQIDLEEAIAEKAIAKVLEKVLWVDVIDGVETIMDIPEASAKILEELVALGRASVKVSQVEHGEHVSGVLMDRASSFIESSSYHHDRFGLNELSAQIGKVAAIMTTAQGKALDAEEKARAADPLLAERGRTHGRWDDNSAAIQAIKDVIAQHTTSKLRSVHKEALDMFAVKIGRIITGDPEFPDHWDDIGGYAGVTSAHCKPKEKA